MKVNPIQGPEHNKKISETIRKLGKKTQPKVVNK